MSETPLAYGHNGHGRDALGRFVPGNQAAAGHPRPFAAQAAALRKAFVEAVTPEDLAAVAHKLISKAKAGDLGAIKLLLSWTLGKPDEPLWPDAVDPPAAGFSEMSENSGITRQARGRSPEASMDDDPHRRAVAELGRLVLAARAAEAAAQNAPPPEALD